MSSGQASGSGSGQGPDGRRGGGASYHYTHFPPHFYTRSDDGPHPFDGGSQRSNRSNSSAGSSASDSSSSNSSPSARPDPSGNGAVQFQELLPDGNVLQFTLQAEVVSENEDEPDDAEMLSEAERMLHAAIFDLISGESGRPGYFTRGQLMELLQGRTLSEVIFEQRDRRRRVRNPNRFPPVPSEVGRNLMMTSGVFGAHHVRDPRPKPTSIRMYERELGLGTPTQRRANSRLIVQEMLPTTKPDTIIHYDDPVCCGQFSNDGNFFYTCGKDFKVRLYDTSRMNDWKHYKTVEYPFGQWTMTDAHLSPDNKFLAYTSLRSDVCITPTDPRDTGDPYTLDFSDHTLPAYRGDFPIFSIRFSGDGRTLVAGTGHPSSVIVYDVERRQAVHRVQAHQDDVNAVCFADKSSPHILYSGSDDCIIKVWDTRSIGDAREAAAFVGHIEGITYVDTKSDGRYVLSNGKDQSMKLWDLRMAMSKTDFDAANPMHVTRNRYYDYRLEDYNEAEWFPHPNDNSLVTFRGHKVKRTLIRCHFSPPGSTNSGYLYSGSADGCVYIWNPDATLAAKLDVGSATENTRPGSNRHRRYRVHNWGSRGWGSRNWDTLVRDVSWHPHAPMLVASSWSGQDLIGGTASIHTYNLDMDFETRQVTDVMGTNFGEED